MSEGAAGALSAQEMQTLLALDVPARLATLDADGHPRITPIWFLWHEGAFYMTSVTGKRHLKNLARDPRASICIDTEERVTQSGIRRKRRLKATAEAELESDRDGEWTKRITLKYVYGNEGRALAQRRAAMPRVVISLRPARLVGLGTPDQ